MKTFFKIFLSILLVLILGVSVYFGYCFYNFEDPNKEIVGKIKIKQKEINEIEEQICEVEDEIETIIQDNKEAYKELENWERHNEKLEKILAQ